MAKIKLTEGGFTLIPEGDHIFKIIEVDYDEDFGKMQITMVTKSGMKHTERFSLINNDGETNTGALGAYSYFAKTALNNYNLDEIDSDDIVGCYIGATVTHEEYESKKTKGRMLKAVRLNDYIVASGFDSDTSDDEFEDDEDDDLDDFLDE